MTKKKKPQAAPLVEDEIGHATDSVSWKVYAKGYGNLRVTHHITGGWVSLSIEESYADEETGRVSSKYASITLMGAEIDRLRAVLKAAGEEA